ncbi:MAG: ABC transporter ATP-binding protein [Ruminococcus sp.]|nr:ABC transporter ATP-binding protein [Ruminococcus sp.]
MIEIKNLTKKFDKLTAVDSMNLSISEGSVIGLVGSNGSGKSTLLRMLAGVYNYDKGSITVDGEELFDNEKVKGQFSYIPDFPFFYNNSTINNLSSLYKDLYPNWSDELFQHLCEVFPISKSEKIINMSKGMQRQAALILSLSTAPKYILLDEIFDGLDPVIRLSLKKILIDYVSDRNTTVIIASHNLRELEDLCDRFCLMHKGQLLLESELDEAKHEIKKLQIAFTKIPDGNLFKGLNIVNQQVSGNIINIVIKGNEKDYMPQIKALNPAFVSTVNLTLEELFIYEMGAAGYDVNGIL